MIIPCRYLCSCCRQYRIPLSQQSLGVVVVVVVVVNIVLVTGNTGQAAEPGEQSAEPLSHQNSAWCQMPNSAERWPLIAHSSEIIDPLRPAPFGFCLFGVIELSRLPLWEVLLARGRHCKFFSWQLYPIGQLPLWASREAQTRSVTTETGAMGSGLVYVGNCAWFSFLVHEGQQRIY